MPVHEIAEPRLRPGPDSLVWKFHSDIRDLLGFQPLAGTENCIEQLAQGVEDHSVIFSDFLGRARRSAPPIMQTVYSEDPHDRGRRVRDFHGSIRGTVSDGSRYHAFDPELFNRLPVRVLCAPWAAWAWERTGVDPRRLHKGKPRR